MTSSIEWAQGLTDTKHETVAVPLSLVELAIPPSVMPSRLTNQVGTIPGQLNDTPFPYHQLMTFSSSTFD
jgi:hypothetical protein